jgi:hypothetical protein
MKLTKLWIAALMGAALIPGAVLARDKANRLHQVDSIWVDSNTCSAQLREGLEQRGFLVAMSRRSADASMEVNVRRERARFGDSASYDATLLGENDRVLFSTAGSEESFDHIELCEDISDELIERLENRMG